MPLLGQHTRYVLNHTEYGLALEEASKKFNLSIDLVSLSILALLVFVLLLQFSGLMASKSRLAERLVSRLESLSDWAPVILRVGGGLLLIHSGVTGHLIVGRLEEQAAVSLFSAIQVVTGALLLAGFLTKAAAVGMAGILFASFYFFGFNGLDRLELLGIALVVFFEGGVKASLDTVTVARVRVLSRVGERLLSYRPFSMPLLRVTLGLSLIWLGVKEKLVAGELTMLGIQRYGVPYFPEIVLFTYMFGMLEILIGAHYVLGIFNRIISGIYLLLLVSAVFIFGETLIHATLFAAALTFLIRGAGTWRMDIQLIKQ